MSGQKASENWSSRLGVILAVAGSAVGLGNFLRFPGLVAKYGGGAFMIAYFVSLLIIGVSICWAEWTLGRWGGKRGFHSSPAIIGAIIGRPWGRFLGVLGVIIPVGIYMYYVYIEAWCLGYAAHFLTGRLGAAGFDYGKHFLEFVGYNADGFALEFGFGQVGLFVVLVYVLNFVLIYRGLSKGIEWFCKWAMPALIFIALIIVVRVLTLGTPDPARPEQNVNYALGFMWNPSKPVVERLEDGAWKRVETLASPALAAAREARIVDPAIERMRTPSVWANLWNPELWLAAAGQIFFSLSVGFGVIITYASYLNDRNDVVLSGLTATSANEFCEVGLGGLMTIPAAFLFLGAAGTAGGTFGLGFNVLPLVFAQMPFGQVFGFLFFLLLFLAAITSSLSMLQPGIAFLEEALGIGRKMSVTILGALTAMGSMFVWYFSKDLKALDTIDFWLGTMLIFVQGTILIILFSWVVGVDRGLAEAHKGAAVRIPGWFRPIMQWVCPFFLLGIFLLWIAFNVFGWNGSFAAAAFQPTGYVLDLVGGADHPPSTVARFSVLLILVTIAFLVGVTKLAGERWYGRDGSRLREITKGETP
jgi:neurotransmitter:Na+ symporter, NSS family